MTGLEKKEALAEITKLLSEAQSLVWKAEGIADEYDLDFRMSIGGYGMGGWYCPPSQVDEDDRDRYGIEEGEGFWQASSQSC